MRQRTNHRTSLNVSLTPQLRDAVKSRVDSGAYTSASEVIREALRLLIGLLPRSGEAISGTNERHLTKLQWREIRNALVHGESKVLEHRVQEIDDLYRTSLILLRTRLKRENPHATDEELQSLFAYELRAQAGEQQGDHINPEFEEHMSQEKFDRIFGR